MLESLSLGILLVATLSQTTASVPSRQPRSVYSEVSRERVFPEGSFNTYRSDFCGVSFSFPPAWETLSDLEGKSAGHCTIYLRPTDWDLVRASSDFELQDYGIVIHVAPRSFAETLRTQGFEFRAGKWVYRPGTISSQEPTSFVGAGWLGFEISDLTKRTFKKGGPSAADHLTTIILGNANRSATLTAMAPELDLQTFYSIVRSLVFYSASADRKPAG